MEPGEPELHGDRWSLPENVAETSDSLPEMLVASRVPPRLSVLGTQPLLGRTLSPEEDLLNGPNAAMLSERLWRRGFSADPAVLGKTLRDGPTVYPIVGVLPDSVRFLPPTSISGFRPSCPAGDASA
jgi:hypothetical protein